VEMREDDLIKRARSEEREACAIIAEQATRWGAESKSIICHGIASAIRERGRRLDKCEHDWVEENPQAGPRFKWCRLCEATIP
jgi:hypothetical protein